LPKIHASGRRASICFGPLGCQRACRRSRPPLASRRPASPG